MRLRLHLERNTLPPTLALFPVPDPTNTTIAQLLSAINLTFPLESETWGLEDYSVSINGFECLHYHSVSAVCREDDEVTVRPLQWMDVRSRRLNGREQITADGRHLIDGVPWGRVALRAVDRPEVRIPPRKRRRIMEDGEEKEGEVGQLQITEGGEGVNEEGSEDDEMDEDFDSDGEEYTSTSEEDSESSDSDESEDESGSDFDNDSEDTSSSDSDDSSTDTSDSGSPSVASKTPIRLIKGPAAKPKKAQPTTNGINEIAGAKRKRSVSFADEEPRIPDSILLTEPLPGQGQPQTRNRNARRRDAHKLKVLKEKGELPADAKLEHMREWLRDRPEDWSEIQASLQLDSAASQEVTNTKGHIAPSSVAVLTNGVGHYDTVSGDQTLGDMASQVNHDAASGDVAVAVSQAEANESKSTKKKKKKTHATDTDFPKPDDPEQKRQQLLDAMHSGGIDVTEDSKLRKYPKPAIAGSMESGANQVMPTKDEMEEVRSPTALAQASQFTPGRRLDMASTQRLLYGSLGLRVPKTQDDREKLQQKLAAKATRPKFVGGMNGIPQQSATTNDVAHSESVTKGAELDEDDDSWRSKISLSAVECVVEGLTLSTPPFPFSQRWDKSLKRKMAGRSSQGSNGLYQVSNGRKRKRSGHLEETYDKYNTDGSGDALEYDDVEGTDDFDDEYWEEGALLNGDEEESDIENDGFPGLPTDISDLPSLHEEDAKENDFIAYTELAVDESTAWEPKSVTRLARIAESGVNSDGAPSYWILELSGRDRKQKVFDQDGNRVYAKFEMPDEDGDGEEGRKDVRWQELGDVKLVQRGSVDGSGEAVEEVGW